MMQRKAEIDSSAEADRRIMARIRSRDEAALTEVITTHGPNVRAICLRICRDELDADGVVSTVFWELWNRADRFDSHRGSLRTYVLTLARSRSIDRLREHSATKRKQEKYIDSVAASPGDPTFESDPLETESRKDRARAIQDAIAKLPASQRTAVQLAFFEGLSHNQVADKQELPLGTVKTNIRRGLQRLREFLTETKTAEGIL